MTNNDILRRLRYALNMNNSQLLTCFAQGGHSLTQSDLDLLLKKEEEPDYIDCPDVLLNAFLNGLIIIRRGQRDTAQEAAESSRLNNNIILRKIRIALELKDTDIIAILQAAEHTITKSELSAIFRKFGHRNYMPCKDQLLRKLLSGLSIISKKDLS